MRYILLFVIVIAIILWWERFYWKRRAEILELKIMGKDPHAAGKSLLNAWIDGRIEARLAKERMRDGD
ncbi:MAG: hypothetical protein JSU96_08035 [Acidobacteriota bacterium]|nr:MAG: hypothetical protein JSU96_08035 [Acidobacteriota bacterium]